MNIEYHTFLKILRHLFTYILEENRISGFIYPKGSGEECEVASVSASTPWERVTITSNKGSILLDSKQLNTLVDALEIPHAHLVYEYNNVVFCNTIISLIINKILKDKLQLARVQTRYEEKQRMKGGKYTRKHKKHARKHFCKHKKYTQCYTKRNRK